MGFVSVCFNESFQSTFLQPQSFFSVLYLLYIIHFLNQYICKFLLIPKFKGCSNDLTMKRCHWNFKLWCYDPSLSHTFLLHSESYFFTGMSSKTAFTTFTTVTLFLREILKVNDVPIFPYWNRIHKAPLRWSVIHILTINVARIIKYKWSVFIQWKTLNMQRFVFISEQFD